MSDDKRVVAIITGAAGGLGAVMTAALLEAGVYVVAADIAAAAERAKELAAAAEAKGHRDRLVLATGDVTSYEDCHGIVEHTIRAFGGVHVLVNNAALYQNQFIEQPLSKPGTFLDVPLDQWNKLIDVNVNGPFYMARAVAPYLIAQGWGRIVNLVTSLPTMNRAGASPYGASKAFMETVTSSWAEDLVGTGITVNALFPGGAADTPMIPTSEPRDRATLVRPDVMAAPIVWLCSRASDGVTGYRISAKLWNKADDTKTNLDRSATMAGWRIVPMPTA